MSYEPLHHKYRPQTFADLVGQETIANTLTNALAQSKIAPAYLFTGPRGTGKTSSARILAKSLNCLNSSQPTPSPCGQCEACLAIAKGTALDVIEIDAASNTGVDNIREIIERSRFAPVQCRYKVYAIDECLTGDSLIQTSEGLISIDNPQLKGKKVLSYNENTEIWEYKKILRWLERGTKETVVIKTSNHQIRCTRNHLIRTATGWIEAKNVKEGMKILSPVNVDVEKASTNMVQMDEYDDLQQDINSKAIITVAKLITSAKFYNKLKQYDLFANVDAKKNLLFPTFCKKREEELKVSNLTGKDIHTKKVMESGISEAKILSTLVNNYELSNWDSYTERYLGTEALSIQTHIVDILDYVGHIVRNSTHGWNTKQLAYNNCAHKYKLSLIGDMAKSQPFAKQPVILNYVKFMRLLSQTTIKNQFRWNGLNLLHQKDWHGGTWMMALSNLVHKVALQFFFTLRDFLNEKIKLLPIGLQTLAIKLIPNLILENLPKKLTTTSNWEQNPVENGCLTYNNTQSPQWTTNLEKVESVSHAGHEKVYDLEVEDNHNFVANGLLVHNCHMLSTAAFNALLKTLEEPPPQVVFILATTDPQRVLSTIISRCQRFDYRRIPLEAMVSHLQYIAQAEKIAITKEAITLVAQLANGGLRDAESLLDQLSLLPEQITTEKVWNLVGAVSEQDLLALLKAIKSDRPALVLQTCRQLLDRGREPLVVLQNLASFYLNLAIAKTAPEQMNLVAVTETCWQELCSEATYWQLPLILRGQQQLKEAETQLKNTTQPRLWLEVTLLSLLPGLNQESATTTKPVSAPVTPPQPSQELVQTPVTPVRQSPSESSITESETVTAPAAEVKAEVKVDIVPPTQTTPSEKSSPQPSVIPTTATETFVDTLDSHPPQVEPTDDPVANQQLWSQVIACLHPPTTKALLSQHCHLISFNGSSAVVGISSANLQKLHQRKVPNIEAAFSQVCQHKVKVSLEVAIPQQQETQKRSLAVATPVTPQSSTTITTLERSPSGDISSETLPQTTVASNNGINQAQAANSTSSLPPTAEVTVSQTITPVESSPLETKLTPPSEEAQVKDYSPDDLQHAIESLTQSFEGEVVELETKMFAAEVEELERETIDLSANISNITLGNRPDLSNYDDEEDVPF